MALRRGAYTAGFDDASLARGIIRTFWMVVGLAATVVVTFRGVSRPWTAGLVA